MRTSIFNRKKNRAKQFACCSIAKLIDFRFLWVLVIAGALAVVVALGCALFSPTERGWTLFGPEPFYANDVPGVLNQYEHATTRGWQTDGFGVTFYVVSTEGLSPGSRLNAVPIGGFTVGSAGFPFHCLSWTFEDIPGAGNSSLWARGLGTSLTYDSSSGERRIPLMPEPVGLLLNVLVYIGPALVVRTGWRRYGTRRRKQRNLCVACAYPVAASTDRCPECGAEYAHQDTAT